MKLVEPFRQGETFHPARRPEQAAEGHPSLGGTLLVPPPALLDPGLEVITDNPESGIPGGLNVNLPLRSRGVGVVDDEFLASRDAGLQEQPLPMASPEQVQAEPQVSLEETLPVERGLARPLQAHEDHGFHGSGPQPPSTRSNTAI